METLQHLLELYIYNNLARQSYLFYFCYLIAVEIVANTVICQKSDFITLVFNTLNFTQ